MMSSGWCGHGSLCPVPGCKDSVTVLRVPTHKSLRGLLFWKLRTLCVTGSCSAPEQSPSQPRNHRKNPENNRFPHPGPFPLCLGTWGLRGALSSEPSHFWGCPGVWPVGDFHLSPGSAVMSLTDDFQWVRFSLGILSLCVDTLPVCAEALCLLLCPLQFSHACWR